VFFAVVATLLLIAPAFAQRAASPKKQLTIEDIFRPPAAASIAPRFLEWSPDGKRLAFVRATSDGGEELYSVEAASSQGEVLISTDRLATLLAPPPNLSERERENRMRYEVPAYQWAPDSNGLLFAASGQLWFYDLRGGTAAQLTASAEPNADPKFSPDDRYISFIRRHNLFLLEAGQAQHQRLRTSPAFPASERQLTVWQGDSVLNGEADWLYQEELDVRSNYFWAPDSRRIVFLQMDETQVPEALLVDWLSDNTVVERLKYPQAGEANPRVRLGIIDVAGAATRWLSFNPDCANSAPAGGPGSSPGSSPGTAAPAGEPAGCADIYVPRFGWLDARTVWALVLNRPQNRAELYFFDVESGASRLALHETDRDYLEMNSALRFFPGGFLWPSWRDGYTHLYLYQYDPAAPLSSAAKLVRQITRGDWEVLGLAGLDEHAGVVYFTANKDDWRQENLFRVNLDGTGLRRLTPEHGVHETKMPNRARYFADSFSALATPPRLRLCNLEGHCKQIWRSPDTKEHRLLPPAFVDFTASDGTLLHGVLLLPQAAVAANRKLPLILNPYGGPHEQMVRDEWRTITLFDQVLAQHGFAILKVDNRGMGNRGRKFATATEHRFGAVEFNDQLTALDQLLARYSQLDGNRVGWWGWSFGGTLAAYALTHSSLFKAGVAVAPVTDWQQYDSTYTERYLGLPDSNRDGYKSSSILEAASNLSGRLLIAHGTSDDNVWLQNSMQLVNRLISAGKQFDLELYPGSGHGIIGGSARAHLYRCIQAHFERWLAAPDQAPPPRSDFAR
jgi:dipeptidyl-peptidase-4